MDGVRLRTSHGVGTAGAAEDPSAVALLGRVLDRRYRLDEIIGLGAMGIVFRATHVLIGKTLAVKVLRREHGGTGEVARRFLLEARVASSLKHPNVVDISDFGELEEGGAYYVMEHLVGRTLADRIDRGGPVPPAEAVAIALQICQGLTAAHAQGVVHRDLKPDNVFLAAPRPGKDEPMVKLLDFGIARAGPRRITAMGTVLGTPEYMAPEQALGIDIDARIDLYALGVILFEMLAGSVPFHHAQVAQVIEMQVNATPPRLASRRAELEKLARLDDVIQSLLAKSRDARPPTAEATVTALIAASASDLGRDAADRLQRATIQIGSGMIAEPSEGSAGPRWSEPTPWKGGAKPGERLPDPLLATGPVPTVTRPGVGRRGSPSPARPLAIGALAAVLAGGATFGAVRWLHDPTPGTEASAGTDPDVVEERSRADANDTSSRSIAPAVAAPSRPPTAIAPDERASTPVIPVTAPPAYDTTAVTTPASTTSEESTAEGKPEPVVERSSGRDDKAATKKRPKPELPSGETPREPPPTRPPTSAPPESDPSPKHEPPPAPDPKPGRVPGDLKDPFPAN